MLAHICLAIVVLFSTFFVYLEGHLVVQEAAISRYRRWRNLNRMVASTGSGTRRVVWISLKLICHAFYIGFIQYLNNTVRRLGRNTYEVTYVIRGKTYKMIVEPVKGPAPVVMAMNEMEEDVTDQVAPYLGPRYDWHHERIPLDFFGCKALTLELADGEETTMKEFTTAIKEN